jgi:dihydrofolate reductase
MSRKLILYIATSLDGKIACQDHSITWLEQFGFTDELLKNYHDFMGNIDTTIMGYKTFEKIKDFTPFPYDQLNNWVVSRQKRTFERTDLFGLQINGQEQLKQEIQTLKNQPSTKDIFLIGGGELLTHLFELGLIDECIISFIPIYLADQGIHLFQSSRDILLPMPIESLQFPVVLNEKKYMIRQERYLLS